MITQFTQVYRVAYTYPESGYDIVDFTIGQDPIHTVLLGVDDLPAQREYGLRASIATLFRATARGHTLHQKQFTLRRVLGRAISQFPRQSPTLERAFAYDRIPGRLGCRTSFVGQDCLPDDRFGGFGVFSEISFQTFSHDLLYSTLDFGVVQFDLGLPFKLGVDYFDRYDSKKPFPDVFAGQFTFQPFEHAL